MAELFLNEADLLKFLAESEKWVTKLFILEDNGGKTEGTIVFEGGRLCVVPK